MAYALRFSFLFTLGIAGSHFTGGVFFTRLARGVSDFHLDTFENVIVANSETIAVAHGRFFTARRREFVAHIR